MLNRMFEKLKNLHLMLFTIIYIIINKKVCVFLPCFHTWVEEMSVFGAKRMMTLWKHSNALVCSNGESLATSFIRRFVVRTCFNSLYPF